MVDDGRTDDGRTDGRTTEHGYTISSPCEPDGSGELKIGPDMTPQNEVSHLGLFCLLRGISLKNDIKIFNRSQRL